mgnify:CR=1 FL=1
MFLAARNRFGSGDGLARLTTNFRTVEPVLDWVNAFFGDRMAVEIPGRQPAYEPLHAHRRADSGADHRPLLLGGPHPDPKVSAQGLREAEADDVAVRAGEAARGLGELERATQELEQVAAMLRDLTAAPLLLVVVGVQHTRAYYYYDYHDKRRGTGGKQPAVPSGSRGATKVVPTSKRQQRQQAKAAKSTAKATTSSRKG